MSKSHIEEMQRAVRERLEKAKAREEAEYQEEERRERRREEVHAIWETEKAAIFQRAVEEVNQALRETAADERLRQDTSEIESLRATIYDWSYSSDQREEDDSILYCCEIAYESEGHAMQTYTFALWDDGWIDVKRYNKYGELVDPSRSYLQFSNKYFDTLTEDSASRLLAELVMDAQDILRDGEQEEVD